MFEVDEELSTKLQEFSQADGAEREALRAVLEDALAWNTFNQKTMSEYFSKQATRPEADDQEDCATLATIFNKFAESSKDLDKMILSMSREDVSDSFRDLGVDVADFERTEATYDKHAKDMQAYADNRAVDFVVQDSYRWVRMQQSLPALAAMITKGMMK